MAIRGWMALVEYKYSDVQAYGADLLHQFPAQSNRNQSVRLLQPVRAYASFLPWIPFRAPVPAESRLVVLREHPYLPCPALP